MKEPEKSQADNHLASNEVPKSLYKELQERMEVKIAIKAGLAACLSLYLGVGFAQMLDRPDYLLSGTWCVLSTFVVMQAHLGGTYRAAWVRFLGLFIGSLMGGFFTSIFGSNGIVLGISIIFTVFICSIFRLKDSIRFACFSVCVVMILWGLHPAISPWQFGLYRFLDSILGIAIAVIISHTLWPAQATQKMRQNIATALHHINRLFQLYLSLKPPPKHFERIKNKLIRDTADLIAETRLIIQESELELLEKTRNLEDWSSLIDHLESIFESTNTFSIFQEYQLEKFLDKKLKERLNGTMQQCVKGFKKVDHMLKQKKIPGNLEALHDSYMELNEELTHFRMNRAIKQLEKHDVEHFFVFFYNFRLVIEKLFKMEERIQSLNAETD